MSQSKRNDSRAKYWSEFIAALCGRRDFWQTRKADKRQLERARRRRVVPSVLALLLFTASTAHAIEPWAHTTTVTPAAITSDEPLMTRSPQLCDCEWQGPAASLAFSGPSPRGSTPRLASQGVQIQAPPNSPIQAPPQTQEILLLRDAWFGPNRVRGRRIPVQQIAPGIYMEQGRYHWLDPLGVFTR